MYFFTALFFIDETISFCYNVYKLGGEFILESQYDISLYHAGSTLKDAYIHSLKAHFPFSKESLKEEFFTSAQFNTWIEFTYHQNQEGIIEYAKQDVAAGYKVHFPDRYDSTTGENIGNAPDEYAVNMGEWGATYHYTVSVRNTTNLDRTANVNIWSAENMIFGLKHQSETEYTTTYYNFIANDLLSAETVASVSIPANETVTFEFVTLLGGGLGGLNHAIVIE